MAISFTPAIKQELAKLWQSMTINPGRIAGFQATARKLAKGAARYKAIEKATGVPAVLIAVLHERESSGDFNTYLGNGDPLFSREGRPLKSVHVPEGRGPFRNFEEGAIDALNVDGLAKVKDWSLERVIFEAEKYNGFGYRNKGIRSPYLWGGTSHQQPGKYVRDRVFDPDAIDTQPGAVPLMFTLANMDMGTFYLPLATTATTTPAKIPPPPDIEPPRHPDSVKVPPTGIPQASVAGAGLIAVIGYFSGGGWKFIAIGIGVIAAIGGAAFVIKKIRG